MAQDRQDRTFTIEDGQGWILTTSQWEPGRGLVVWHNGVKVQDTRPRRFRLWDRLPFLLRNPRGAWLNRARER